MSTKKTGRKGKIRIGDTWNAITIIALSQNNPLKAIAEFVENSIDAKSTEITIIRGRKDGENYLRIIDNGEGIHKNEEGIPNFKYVATHVCDSIKRELKSKGAQGIQGEFGIGLLSFWTVGEELFMTSAGNDGKTYVMQMQKGSADYTINTKKTLVPLPGTELMIKPLLPGIRSLSGEKLQSYLASELRDRIKKSGVKITILDKTHHKQFVVVPRRYQGNLLHNLPAVESLAGSVYCEIYACNHSPDNHVELFRNGTRVFDSIERIDEFKCPPWNSGYLQGMIDVPFLNLTPGTRDGIIRDESFDQFLDAMTSLTEELLVYVGQQKESEAEKANAQILKTVQKAFKEAFLSLPREEYDWMEIYSGKKGDVPVSAVSRSNEQQMGMKADEEGQAELFVGEEKPVKEKMQFFDHAGPIHKLDISPRNAIIKIGESKKFKVVAKDRRKRKIEYGFDCRWNIVEGAGSLDPDEGEFTEFTAPEEPGLVRVRVDVSVDDKEFSAEAVITVTDELLKKGGDQTTGIHRGLPGYTFIHKPGQLWRSSFDEQNNLIVINSAHHDFIFAKRVKTRKLRYICRLFSKELVKANFPGVSNDEVLERMVELSIHVEDNL